MLCFLISDGTAIADPGDIVQLPEPRYSGTVSVEETLENRRSIRSYRPDPVSLGQLSQVLWAAQGITGDRGKRAAPSAGALYALETYVIAGNVTGLDDGIYRYIPDGHRIEMIATGDYRDDLGSTSTYNQSFVTDVPFDIVISGVFERITVKYGDRGVQYTYMEAGHASQNIYLQAVALGLGTVAMGAFRDDEVKELVGMAANEEPLYVMPVGYRKE